MADGREAVVTIAVDRGWHEANRPVCAGCMYPIGVRGEAEVAVLGGPVLECSWEEGVWLAHFHCRKADWWTADRTENPAVRVIIGSRTYRILSDQLEYWLKDPEVVWRQGEKVDNGA